MITRTRWPAVTAVIALIAFVLLDIALVGRARQAHAQDEALSAFLSFREMWLLVAAQAIAGTVAAALLLCRVRGGAPHASHTSPHACCGS